jgi:hypothetical protein
LYLQVYADTHPAADDFKRALIGHRLIMPYSGGAARDYMQRELPAPDSARVIVSYLQPLVTPARVRLKI